MKPVEFAMIAGITLAPLAARSQVFSDQTFPNGDWMLETVYDTTPSQGALCLGTQVDSGLPGFGRAVSHHWQITPGGVSIAFAHLMNGTPIDPSTLSGIVSISFSLDIIADSAPWVNAIGFGLVLRQGGSYFTAVHSAAIAGAGWTHIAGTVSAAQFLEALGGAEKPDLSTSGAPFRIGFYSANGGSGGFLTNDARGRADNFSVRFNRTCPADLNGDGLVEDADFSLFVTAYDLLDCADQNMAPGCPSDLDASGFVDDADFVIFVGAYNSLLCP